MDAFLPIRDASFAAIDFESAGSLPGECDVPIQVGISLWSPAAGWSEDWVSYISSPRQVTWAAAKVHGIRTSDLSLAPSFSSLWPELSKRLHGRCCVAHQGGTERRFLSQLPGNAFGPWIDTLHLSRRAIPQLASYRLEEVCAALQLHIPVPQRTWHDALFDARASLEILVFLIQQFDLWDQPIATLFETSNTTN